MGRVRSLKKPLRQPQKDRNYRGPLSDIDRMLLEEHRKIRTFSIEEFEELIALEDRIFRNR